MKTVAIILARGGSKEIPNKNIKIINGNPLISYVINAAKKSNVDEVWVSTDCKKIKDISIYNGAKVIDRPSEISLDTSQSEEALLHFAQNVDFDVMVFIQPTSPLLESSYINEGLLRMKFYDSVFSAYKEHWIPRWSSDIIPLNWDINNRPRRQDMEEVYVENGAFYITTKENLINSKNRFSGKIGVIEMPISKGFQIDTLEDFKFIEFILGCN
tara:strand:- start:105 stop:746 length:642 start_codon:yes stop_codon:yes gene_type:complete